MTVASEGEMVPTPSVNTCFPSAVSMSCPKLICPTSMDTAASVAVKACEMRAAYRAGQYASWGSNGSLSNLPRLRMIVVALTKWTL